MKSKHKKILKYASCVGLLFLLIALGSCGQITDEPGAVSNNNQTLESSEEHVTEPTNRPLGESGGNADINVEIFVLPGRIDSDVRAQEIDGTITVIAVFDIANFGCDIVFGDFYRLEINDHGEWNTIRQSPENDDALYTNSLPGGGGARVSFRMEWQDLMPGDYRLAKIFHAQSDHDVFTEATVEFTVPEGLVIERPIMFDGSERPQPAPENSGVSLEYSGHSSRGLYLIIANNSGNDIRYGSGYEIAGNQWGSAGESDMDSYDLPDGEKREIFVTVPQLGYGEFSVTINIVIEQGSPDQEKIYKLQADFAIDNEKIPQSIISAAMKVDFATPVGAIIEITNGFDSGRLFYDKSYRIQQNTDGIWNEINTIASDNFVEDEFSLASRQVLSLTEYWAWLYGELPPGEYRIEKIFWHRTGAGEENQYVLSAIFALDGEPIPDEIINDAGSTWRHPFGGITTFRAAVTDLVDSGLSPVSSGNTGLLVNSLTPFWGTDSSGEPFYIWSTYSVTVLDISGRHIPFNAIPIGAIIDITFTGMILTSYPGQIGGSLLIQIVA